MCYFSHKSRNKTVIHVFSKIRLLLVFQTLNNFTDASQVGTALRLHLMTYRRGGAVGQSVRLACGRKGVRIPDATYLVKTGRDSSTAKRSTTDVSFRGPH